MNEITHCHTVRFTGEPLEPTGIHYRSFEENK